MSRRKGQRSRAYVRALNTSPHGPGLLVERVDGGFFVFRRLRPASGPRLVALDAQNGHTDSDFVSKPVYSSSIARGGGAEIRRPAGSRRGKR